MSTTLPVLRLRNEASRFERQRKDDARTAVSPVDAEELAAALRKAVDGEVRFDRGSRALYATDGSNYRQVPIGVVIPRHKDDVLATIRLARQAGAPILSRGCGTSLAGQCCNVAVVMDFTKYMHRVLRIDAERRIGVVEPGCVLDDLRKAASAHGLTFGPDPATHSHCAVGGMLGNNSCGIHSLMSKNNGLGLRTSDNTHRIEVTTYDGARFWVGPTSQEELAHIIAAGGRRGEIHAAVRDFVDRWADMIRRGYPKLERRVSGYNLPDLLPENGFNLARALVGSEGNLVSILEAEMTLIPEPKARSLLMLGYPDVFDAAKHLELILEHKPTGLEGVDDKLFDWVRNKGDKTPNLKLFPDGHGWLLVEFGGDSKQDTDDQARRLMDHLRRESDAPDMKLYDDPEQEELIWKVREGSLGSTAWVPGHPDTWPGWEDSAVPVDKVAEYLPKLRALFSKYGYHPSLYGHFGQGCIHCRVGFDLYTSAGIAQFKSFMDEATNLVSSLGGSYSGEHGDGQARGQYLEKMYGPQLVEAMREFKRIWDPQWKMNPGKTIDAYPVDANLRLGPDYNPPQPETHFAYPADRHSFARAALRCVGVGKCRREGGGTMCPSYMVTREEKHSTRGRARLLFEMMNGEVLDNGWKSEEVKDALDLCLSCKGCKGDCPVNVDMATYKAEFLSHYYDGKLRPRHAYAFGWIHLASKLASYAPSLANLITQTPGLRSIAKFLAGIDPRRKHIPAFAPESFQHWFARRKPRNPAGEPVVLFPDTFNNFYKAETAKAAVDVLEDAGFRVDVPMQDICCGRPLYDYGFLGMAKRWLEDLLVKLRPQIQAGVPMVVLEPSCWAVFMDEITNLLPNNRDAQRMQSQTYTLSTFLKERAPHYRPPPLHLKGVLHGHCHQKSMEVLGSQAKGKLQDERTLLGEMGVEFSTPEDGCCGMAGAFGYEEGKHYDVSIACGERALLPKVRQAGEREIIITDGFSCREQIEQETDRRALHMAEVLQLAMRHGPTAGRPEESLQKQVRHEHRAANLKMLALLAAGAVIGGGVYLAAARRGSGHRVLRR